MEYSYSKYVMPIYDERNSIAFSGGSRKACTKGRISRTLCKEKSLPVNIFDRFFNADRRFIMGSDNQRSDSTFQLTAQLDTQLGRQIKVSTWDRHVVPLERQLDDQRAERWKRSTSKNPPVRRRTTRHPRSSADYHTACKSTSIDFPADTSHSRLE
jgi:hypothetical protein